METRDAIRSIRVVRTFSDRRIEDDAMRQILDAGRHAGSSKNLQRWAFLVVRDRETIERLSHVGPYARHLAGANVAVATIVPRPGDGDWDPAELVMWDLGRAAQNMVLAAWEMGIGSAPATVYDEPLCRSILEYPEDRFCGYVWSFGYPADPADLTRAAKAGGRVGLDDIVHWERW